MEEIVPIVGAADTAGEKLAAVAVATALVAALAAVAIVAAALDKAVDFAATADTVDQSQVDLVDQVEAAMDLLVVGIATSVFLISR